MVVDKEKQYAYMQNQNDTQNVTSDAKKGEQILDLKLLPEKSDSIKKDPKNGTNQFISLAL